MWPERSRRWRSWPAGPGPYNAAVNAPSFVSRAVRHVRLSRLARRPRTGTTPPFLILFVNSICNLTCEHCFYWRSLNAKDDLTLAEIERLAADMGPIENLNLSGGEPFLRPDLAEIAETFIELNGVRQIYVPTSGFFPDRTETQLRRLLARARGLELFACELSLEGLPEYHDRFRGHPQSFTNALATYDRLAALQREDPRVRIHAISTATHENLDEIRRLTEWLHERCPAMDHHNLAVIRGDRKNPALAAPPLAAYKELYRHVAAVWRDRERSRFGSSVEPMLQWAKSRTLETDSQYVPCTAGVLTGVVYANGDVAVCETHAPVGNLRERSFREIWASPEAVALRARITARLCHCTNEVFLWPSVVFQPAQLARAWVGSRLT
jgi:MoaA/NifB/PqqE/SkfB family radical SAM enzyme